jgi:DNA replicative helicase MCM subunit Mcm2 (Cdc46/Mcm family)
MLFYQFLIARMRLSNNVENKDVDFAISIMLESFI